MERQRTDQEIVRREKAEKIRELGLDPFGQKFERTAYASELQEKYASIPHDDFESILDEYTVVGRIIFIRKMGKASFFSRLICYSVLTKSENCISSAGRNFSGMVQDTISC